MRASIVFALMAVLGCTAVRQQKQQPPRPDDLHFHNLRVLPQNIPRDELIELMKEYSRALGVQCGHCHVQIATAPEPLFDFPSDAKPEKEAGRVMIVMTERMNRDYLAKIPETYTTITCWSCHRGEVQPDVQPSAPVTAER